MSAMEFHEYANLFPLIEGEQFDALALSVKNDGLHEPIWLYEGKILDGRNRYLACLSQEIKPEFQQYTGSDPLGFVVLKNIYRRDLTPSQRACIAVDILPFYEEQAKERKLSTLKQYSDREKIPYRENVKGKASEFAAEVMRVNPRYVSNAKRVKEERPELFEEMKSGLIHMKEALHEIHEQERGDRRQKEAERLAQETDEYPVILADPAWEYDFSKSDSRRIDNHYLPSSLDEMKQLTPPATDNAVLFMWATSPKLREALELMCAWKFEYKTCMVWVKDKIGMGYYARQKHELLLIGTKGKGLELPDSDIRPESVFVAPRLGHSEKPEKVYEIIETMYPHYGKYEMFARGKREGWEVWGDES